MELEVGFQDSRAGGVRMRRVVDRGAVVTELSREALALFIVLSWPGKKLRLRL
jgi:hypothetical protein